MGFQGKNQCRWFCGTIQSSPCCSRFFTKVCIDYDEFFPVVRSESIRTVIALAAQNGLRWT